MTKRLFLLITLLSALLIFGITGCSSGDDAEDDTLIHLPPVTTPRPTPTPTPTPIPECRHFWRAANCHTPEYCLDCGETRGAPLEHIFGPANFQLAAQCELCGDFYGQPLTPNFITYGFEINTIPGRPFEYTTGTRLSDELTTTGTVTLMDVDIFASREGFPPRAGREYILARFLLTFDDENAISHGFAYLSGQFDYYTVDTNETAIMFDNLRDSDIPGFKIANTQINFYGEYFDYHFRYESISVDWIESVAHVVFEYVFLVPIGFDGIIVYLSSTENWSATAGRVLSDNFDENTLFFRLRTLG